MSSNYPFNVDQNYAPISIASEDGKCNRNSGILSPTDPQHSSLVFKEDKGKDSPPENMKIFHQQQVINLFKYGFLIMYFLDYFKQRIKNGWTFKSRIFKNRDKYQYCSTNSANAFT